MTKNIITLIALTFGLCATFVSTPTLAQDADSTFIVVYDYMKVTGGGAMQIETDVWAPIHQARIDAGDMRSWTLYSTPYTVDQSYDYVTANAYRGWANYETAWTKATAHIESLYPGEKGDEMMARTAASRDIVKTEVWTGVDWTGDMHGAPVVMMNFFRVPDGGWSAYERLESEIWKPMHEKAVAAGAESGWGVIRLAFPGGAQYGYNAASMNFATSLSTAMNMPGPPSFIEEVHPNLTWGDVSHMTTQTRKAVRFELWNVVDHVHREE